MKLELKREILDPVTLGTLFLDGEYFGLTLERPWRDNRQSVSCIPPGKYFVDLTPSPKFGRNMLEVLKVPKRVGIRIHGANEAEELKGCIAVGRKVKGYRLSESLVPDLMVFAKQARDMGEDITLIITDPK